MRTRLRKLLFESLYKNRYLYRFASTVPFAGQWRVWQRLVLPRIRGLDVLELGCGLGDLLADMLNAGYHCHAIEQSPEMVATARDTLRKRKMEQPSLVIQGSVQSLPFSSNAFDTVVSTFPTEYIYDPDTIAEVTRVLRPGGRLIVIEGAHILPNGFTQSLLAILQSIVYGTRNNTAESNQAHATTQRPDDNDSPMGTHTTILSSADFASLIPLERFGLRHRSECVHGPFWEVVITVGDKIE